MGPITSYYSLVNHPSPLLDLQGLRKEFSSAHGPVVALEDITLSIPKGSIHGIVGRSGAGKSTLIRCLTGLEEPPRISSTVPGRQYLLRAERLGSLSPGAPVYYHGLEVGQVLGYELMEDARGIDISIFVEEAYADLVRTNSRFWNASGIELSTRGGGVALMLTNIREAMSAHAATMEDVNLQFEDAQGDVGRQLNQVQNFIAQGVDAIIVNAADTSATQGITDMVTQAGIPLVYVNLGPAPGTQLPEKVAVVVSDHVVSGRLQMEGLAECMGGKGNVAIMLGERAANATQQRTAGNKEIIEKFPDIKVVQEQTANYQRNQAIDLMTNWIVGGEEINAVAANNDEMAIGAILAMQQAGMSPDQVCVGGVDATADALDYMEQGLLDVTVFQDAKGQGRGALDAALKLVKGEAVEQYTMIPYELVTPENMAEFRDR